MGSRQVPSLPHGHAIRGIYEPLCTPMAKDDAHGICAPHRWSAGLEEYDFTVRHRPGKVKTHVDGLSRLPVEPAPPEDALLHIQVDSEEEARRLAQELHTATHLGGQALWKLFSDRYSHKAGRRICIEMAQSCPQCQRERVIMATA